MSTRPCAWRRCKVRHLADELRWVLLGLSLPLLAGIWWWTARRTGQAPGNPELRESTPPLDPRHSDGEEMRPATEPRDWGVPPFEPLSIRTANFDGVPILDGPMMVGADPGSVAGFAPAPMTASAPAAATAPVPMSTSAPAASSTPAPMSTSAPEPSSTPAPSPATAPPSVARGAADLPDRFVGRKQRPAGRRRAAFAHCRRTAEDSDPFACARRVSNAGPGSNCWRRSNCTGLRSGTTRCFTANTRTAAVCFALPASSSPGPSMSPRCRAKSFAA